MPYRKVSGIVFHEDQKYVLVCIENGKYCPIKPKNDLKIHYNPIIAMMKSFYDEFGKIMDCWEHVVNYNEFDYYTIVTDLKDIICDVNHDIISIDDINNIDCTPELKWLIYMALDINIRNESLKK
jgi:hypothetical protein